MEESQMEASRLRQKAEELVKDSELVKDRELLLPPSPTLASFDHLPELTGPRGLRVVLYFSLYSQLPEPSPAARLLV